MSTFVRTLLILIVMMSVVSSVGAVDYRLVDICPFVGYTSFAADINSSSQVVGFYGNQAFVWSRADGLRELGDLGGGYSKATSINDRGEIVGSSLTSAGVSHAFYWSKNSGMLDIGVALLGDGESSASKINNRGQILLHPPAQNWWRPVLWDPVEGLKPVNSRFGTGHVISHDMNGNGEIVGFYNGNYPDNPPFIWDSVNGMRDLPKPTAYTEPYAINNDGVVVGRIGTGSGTNACLWDPTNGLMDLGTISGYREICAYGINEGWLVVGDMSQYSNRTAFVWTKDSGFQPLPTGCENPYGASDTARAVNDAGVIVGSANYGRSGTYVYRAAVWEPVPEPASLVVVLGGCSMAFLFWRKR